MWRWRGAGSVGKGGTIRRLASAVRRKIVDDGDWSYASEWWGDDGSDEARTVFRAASQYGNGEVSVVAYPSSSPAPEQWPAVERELELRYAKLHPESEQNQQFKILGYQWRVLRFNDNTRQSTTKVMAAYRKSDSASFYLMPQPHCLCVPYIKSMVSAGLAALTTSNFDLLGAVTGKRILNVLCIGHGGGNLPLFLASKIKGAIVHSVEIDPVVISASVEAMGFPASAVKDKTLFQLPLPQPKDAEELFWQGVHERIYLYRSDAEDFILNSPNTYDMIFIDAYDGDDIFPHKFWDPHGSFLKALRRRLHPDHGTAVVNLHSDSDVLASGTTNFSHSESILPMGKYVSHVCRAYKENLGFAFKVSVPWLCNITLVACSGEGLGSGKHGVYVNREMFRNTLMSKASMVENVLDLPFPCLEYVKRGLVIVD
ncbi:Uncharacterized protein M6B38_248380 [Iris pallida]|uniref:S-adenosyl-L-methionine-dependent methyltransferase superfamily protein n=1 Tax=Iris pallida TaxID=29817 RepID=A0AAX6DG87_IRIPA|nr:Uncharacterized protein M6B38_248380 [Iris pallida]